MYNLKWKDRPIRHTSARPLPGTEVTLLLRNHGASGVGQVNACSILIHVSHLLIFICFSIMFHFSKMYLAVHFPFLSIYQRVPCTSQHLHKRKGKEGYICDVPGEQLEWPVVTNLAPECTDGVHLNTGGGGVPAAALQPHHRQNTVLHHSLKTDLLISLTERPWYLKVYLNSLPNLPITAG